MKIKLVAITSNLENRQFILTVHLDENVLKFKKTHKHRKYDERFVKSYDDLFQRINDRLRSRLYVSTSEIDFILREYKFYPI